MLIASPFSPRTCPPDAHNTLLPTEPLARGRTSARAKRKDLSRPGLLSKKGGAMALTNSLAGRNLGMLLLGLWLILTGLLPFLNIRVSATVNTALAVLAIVAGILILLRR